MNYILAYVEPFNPDGIKLFVGDERAMVEKLNDYLDPPSAFTTVKQAVRYIKTELDLEGDEMLTLATSAGKILVTTEF